MNFSLIKRLSGGSPILNLFVSAIISLVPIALYVGASALGRIGCAFGYVLEIFIFVSWPFLGVYFLVALIIDRPPTKIKAVYLLLLAVCVGGALWGFYSHPFLTEFELKLKRVYNNVSELQMWAVDILRSHEDQVYTLDREDYPNWIKSKSFPEPVIRVFNEAGTRYKYVELSWGFGSQFGQYGLVVGRPGMPKQGRKWADGIYFYVEPQPRGWFE